MKKTIFLKGLAAVVLGCMFTSCEKEELNATFQPNGATVKIEVTVKDVLTNTEITNAAITATDLNDAQKTINGTIVEYNAPKGNGIKGGEVTVTAKANDFEGSVKVNINEVKAGGKDVYFATIYISSTFDFQTEVVEADDIVKWASSLSHVGNVSHSYTHDGMTNNDWFNNTTDYYQPYSINVEWNPVKNVTDITWSAELDEVEKAQITAEHADQIAKMAEKKSETYNATASAWSYFNAYAKFNIVKENWTIKVKSTNTIVATFSVEKVSIVAFKHVEYAALGHESHYHGHGHGHGGASNAGGGISIAE